MNDHNEYIMKLVMPLCQQLIVMRMQRSIITQRVDSDGPETPSNLYRTPWYVASIMWMRLGKGMEGIVWYRTGQHEISRVLLWMILFYSMGCITAWLLHSTTQWRRMPHQFSWIKPIYWWLLSWKCSAVCTMKTLNFLHITPLVRPSYVIAANER